MKKIIFFILLFGIASHLTAQNDSLRTVLKEVIVVADKTLKKNSKGYKIITLNDSVLVKNTESFTTLLRFNSPIYLREYGAGGTSSASFRGTSASNTAVVWNGININSINNGQTGFNSLTVSLFDVINIRSGGGSIEYGSGAIGGTVHLNDELSFKNKQTIDNQFVSSFGSYNTSNNLYKFNLSSQKLAVKLGISYNKSNNDYPLLKTDFKNSNGAYKNISFNTGLSYKLSSFSELNFYSTSYLGDRLFSGELPNPTSANEKYKDFNNRNLLVYNHQKGSFTNEVKIAFLTQEYHYYGDKNTDKFNFGKSNRYLINYQFGYKIPKINATINSFSEYESVFGKTDQINTKNRRQFSQSLIYNQNINNIFFFDTKIRKDFNSDFDVPFSYAMGIKVNAFKNISFRANGSKNYRVPTYNDLYWPGQGNPNLKPETALQSEFGVVFNTKNLSIDISGFYISAKDKIVWTPNGDPNRPGIWTPINLSKTMNKGIEFTLSYQKNFNKHFVNTTVNYSYTDAKNTETNNFLTFVPKHLLNGSLGYSYKRFSAFYQQLFTSKTFTTESNSNDFIIPSFFVSNLGADYMVLKTEKQQIFIGLKVNNLFNELYFTQPRRPMPNRNFNFNINYKF
ncbi:TonB-dependent receptor [Polaribacter batillariae]|uniref:TonB-dependent receptor n=1 Tax=Polaribacter batillariae TaxID=2808900 RepID=A0ABX7SX02_9FLAO|nr:TonB-dependent receptor [Polaribacter batillariae]QTD37848.1 TonB-dependent receptor [Polaribacter batillariae]